MNRENLMNWLSEEGINFYVLEKETAEDIIEKLIFIGEGQCVRYLWSNYASTRFKIKIKLSCDLDEYKKKIRKIFFDEMMYNLVIDDVCITDIDNPLIVQINGKGLVALMTNFYWELDEIYILNTSLSWFVAINHNFELALYGVGNECKDMLRFIQ